MVHSNSTHMTGKSKTSLIFLPLSKNKQFFKNIDYKYLHIIAIASVSSTLRVNFS